MSTPQQTRDRRISPRSAVIIAIAAVLAISTVWLGVTLANYSTALYERADQIAELETDLASAEREARIATEALAPQLEISDRESAVAVAEAALAQREATLDAREAQTVPPAPVPGVVLTDGQRATLDTTFGASLGTDGPLSIYCPMDASGRSYFADLVARQFDGYTPSMVMQYLVETCP